MHTRTKTSKKKTKTYNVYKATKQQTENLLNFKSNLKNRCLKEYGPLT